MSDAFYGDFENLIGPENFDMTADPPVLRPADEEQLCGTVVLAGRKSVKIHIVGGGTLPAPSRMDNCVTVSLRALSAVREVSPHDFVIVAQAGAVADYAVKEAHAGNLHLPLDITSGSAATVGGAFASGSVAPSSAGYGSFRDAVIGVRCVTAEGKVVRFGGRTPKNVTGYDITWFLWGTMGLFAIVTELTVKVLPLPESRTCAVARFARGARLSDDIFAQLGRVNHVTSLELIAPDGLGGETVTGIGIEGMETLVTKSAGQCRRLMESPGSTGYDEGDPGTIFRPYYRDVAKRLTGPGFYTVTAPPSASGAFLDRLSRSMPNAPVIAHPLLGRFHIVCADAESVQILEKTSLVVGGKQPVEWGAVVTGGIQGLFTGSELALARSLKRELDPHGLLNPHLGLL
ncbi:FAD-binding oxidoreductase [bacterium]|nr:FAD-binding oxidoreductase [bacterium]